MGNTLEIHDGDFHLTIYLDKLYSFPRANFCRLLRLLRRYPDAMEPLGTYLRTAKRLYTTYTRLLQIYENQGGTHK